MREKKLVQLLSIIKSNSNINKLLRQNVSFKEVTELTNLAIQSDLLIYEKGKISLSETGDKYLADNMHLIKLKNKDEWIEKDLKNKIDKIDKNFIFLPHKDELTF